MIIRRAREEDISRIAEILVFAKRVNYRSIFHNDAYSFGELQVLPVAQEYVDNKALLDETWVYEDEFVKGLIQIGEGEIKKLYVDSFFTSEGIGAQLIEFAIDEFNAKCVQVLEKNERAVAFYKRHGFQYRGNWKYEEGTTERLQLLER